MTQFFFIKQSNTTKTSYSTQINKPQKSKLKKLIYTISTSMHSQILIKKFKYSVKLTTFIKNV